MSPRAPDRRRAAAAALVLSALLAGGCSLTVDFPADRLAETSPALCGDGRDNDGNGLRDCQEFGCLAAPACCGLPQLLLHDDFEASPCSADPCQRDAGVPATGCLDADLWAPWGAPEPVVCEGLLLPDKRTACYEVGAVGRVPLPFGPGLHVSVGLAGRLEPQGRLTVGLSRQSQAVGSSDECASLDPIAYFASATQTWSANGAVLAARFGDLALGQSPEVTDDARHLLELAVRADRRLHFLLDGIEFAASPADLPLPSEAVASHLVLAGRSLRAGFTDVRATAETQCDAPGAWEPALDFLTFDIPPVDTTRWDGHDMAFPAVWRRSATVVDLLYVGCRGNNAVCVPRTRTVGLAESVGGGRFERQDEETGLLGLDGLSVMGDPFDRLDVGVVVVAGEVRVVLGLARGLLWYRLTDAGALVPVVAGHPIVAPGAAGEWDDGEVCCGAPLVAPDGTLRLYYAGRAVGDEALPWRIGLATSADGIEFAKHPDNPLLTEGDTGAFDERAATEPAVAFDAARALYRMWYGGRGAFGRTGLGYAVSSDGVTWEKYPGNPVVTDAAVGLAGIGGPAVLADDGELRMWFHGRAPGSDRSFIYQLVNRGAAAGDAE